ncbi:kinesin-like protein KIF15-A isoform X2 [Oncorhynchus masou masou]|uniref:kinesin-like protein KIF15-A isoform X2 n=1 Tax=Oncorhynchus masou masou TaxID=90313 RepID=UPI003183D454
MTTSGWMFCPQMEVLQEELVYATKEVELLTKVLDEQASLLQASQYQTAQKEATTLQGKLKQQQEAVERTVRGESANHVPQSSVIPEVLPQVIELESRCSSMMTMEVPLTELNYERAAKNEEIQKLKGQLNEKEMVRMEIQAVFDELYAKQNQLAQNGNTNADVLNEAIHQNFLRELQEERSAMTEESGIAVGPVSDQCPGAEEPLPRGEPEGARPGVTASVRCLNVGKPVPYLSEENCKLVGHKNHKQRIEYLVKLKEHQTSSDFCMNIFLLGLGIHCVYCDMSNCDMHIIGFEYFTTSLQQL